VVAPGDRGAGSGESVEQRPLYVDREEGQRLRALCGITHRRSPGSRTAERVAARQGRDDIDKLLRVRPL